MGLLRSAAASPLVPYGGMENPCLTFVTPTLLAGDRSLVSVVARNCTAGWAIWSGNVEDFGGMRLHRVCRAPYHLSRIR